MLRNYFTLTQKNNTQTAHNTLNNVFDGYARVDAICKYIYVKTAKNETYFLKTQIVESNFDPSKGALFCGYSATLDSVFLQDEVITAVGFCPAQNQSFLTNAAEFNYKKSEGEKLVICGTIFLELNKTDTCFTAGDNKLVKALLGAIDFPYQGYTMGTGTNPLPVAPINRGAEGFAEIKPVTFLITQTTIIFNATFLSPLYEVVLMLDGVAVLRAVPTLPNQIKITSKIAEGYGSVSPEDEFATGCSDVLVNYNTLLNYSVSTPAESLLYLSETDYRLPADSVLRGHFSAKYFAAVSRGRITLYQSKNGKVLPFKWYKGRDAAVLSDGTAVIFSDEVIMYKDGTETRSGIKSGSVQNKAVYYGGKYIVACADEGAVRLNFLGSNFVREGVEGVINTPNGTILLDVCGCAIAVRIGSGLNTFLPSGVDSELAAWINVVSGYILNLKNPHFQGDRLVFYDDETGFSGYMNFMDNQYIECQKKGRIAGEFLICDEDGKTNIFSLEYPDSALISLPPCTSILQQSETYALTDQGKLITLIAGANKIKISSSKIRMGDRVSYNLYQKSPVSGGINLILTQ